MAELSEKMIQEMKDLMEKRSGKEVTWEEATEGAHNLAGFAEIMFDLHVKDLRRKARLKEERKGFMLEGVGYTCGICKSGTREKDNWYDKWGIKCLTCQKAIDKRIIPGSCAKNDDKWYSKYDLESKFNFNHRTLKKFIKEGVLKARIVPGQSNRPHAYLFLIKDNKEFLPPKNLAESQMVKTVKEDGSEWFHSEPWYHFYNPKERLKGYKILDYLVVTEPT